jgi:hypothetical protein
VHGSRECMGAGSAWEQGVLRWKPWHRLQQAGKVQGKGKGKGTGMEWNGRYFPPFVPNFIFLFLQ